LITSSEDRTIRIWDVRSGENLRVLRPPGTTSLFALSPDGSTLAVPCVYRQEKKPNHFIVLMTLADGRVSRLLRGHTGEVRSVTSAPDGKRLASCGADKTVRRWNTSNGESEQVIQTEGIVGGLASSPNGNRLVEARDNDTPAIRVFGNVKVIPLQGTKDP